MSIPTKEPSRRIYHIKDLPSVTGLSLTTIWRLQKAGQFPPRVQLSPGRVGVPASAVEEWLNSREQAA